MGFHLLLYCIALHSSYAEVGKDLSISSTTVTRQIKELERWLGKDLIDREKDRKPGEQFELTSDGEDFFNLSGRIIELTGKYGLINESSITRIQPDKSVMVDGQKIDRKEIYEIGEIMVDFRKSIS